MQNFFDEGTINEFDTISYFKILGWCPEGAFLALVNHPSSDVVTMKVPYGVDVLHQPALHPIIFCWVS